MTAVVKSDVPDAGGLQQPAPGVVIGLAGRLPATVPRGEISSQVSTALLDLHASVSRDSLPNGIVVWDCVYLAGTRPRSVVTMGTMR